MFLELRLNTGLSVSKVAELLGVGFYTVTRWESGESYPCVSLASEISKLYNVDIMTIFPDYDFSLNLDELPLSKCGNFKVSCNGDIYKLKNGIFVLANQYCISRDKRYKAVNIYVNKKQKVHYVHRLVAETYIPNPKNLPCINHIDNNGHNNSVDNLEWCTYQHNTIHAYENGLIDHKLIAVCKLCGKKIKNKHNNEMCTICMYKESNKAITLEKRKKRGYRVFCNCDINDIPKKHKEIIVRFMNGETFRAISKDIGISQQRVQKIFDKYEKSVI